MDFINPGAKFWVTHGKPVGRVGLGHYTVKFPQLKGLKSLSFVFLYLPAKKVTQIEGGTQD